MERCRRTILFDMNLRRKALNLARWYLGIIEVLRITSPVTFQERIREIRRTTEVRRIR